MSNHPIILFDGVCNLCNGSVQFIIRRDPQAHFIFAALQSAVGEELLKHHQIAGGYLDSIVLVEEGKVYAESDAALHIARQLSGLWSVLYWGIVIPRPIRDGLYRWIARNRYRWFGKQESCMLPTKELRARFL